MDPLTYILIIAAIGLTSAITKLVKATAARQRAKGRAEIMRAQAELLHAEATHAEPKHTKENSGRRGLAKERRHV
ncbi:hypothetical protein ABIA33_007569 [Streptacidiphilus sp. MAP12-16]|uniref:hypothetical protein n=1 Tax=Streptacidiphilus sp. MAP12-16 TaxID=3156300 RepID=UPI0035157773